MIRYFLILSLLFASAAVYSQQTIFLVRHAEKVDSSRDPELSLAGKARAVRLMELLQDAGVKSIYSTDYLRTRNTANPLSEKLNIPIRSYRPFEEELVTKLKATKDNALVVGHSNTIPSLVNQLIGEKKFQQLDDDQYSKLFVVSFVDGKPIHYVLRF